MTRADTIQDDVTRVDAEWRYRRLLDLEKTLGAAASQVRALRQMTSDGTISFETSRTAQTLYEVVQDVDALSYEAQDDMMRGATTTVEVAMCSAEQRLRMLHDTRAALRVVFNRWDALHDGVTHAETWEHTFELVLALDDARTDVDRLIDATQQEVALLEQF